MEKKNGFLGQLAICVGLLILIWGGYYFAARKISMDMITNLEDDFSWIVQVDSVMDKGEEIELSGFAFKLNTSSKKGAFRVVLHDLKSGEYLFPKMKYEERKDVNDYFSCEYDYSDSGFKATINANKINMNENSYEILILPDGTRSPYKFETYLSRGELMYVNPEEYTPLEVGGTGLEEVVEKGILRVYEPENHMYVYQYKGELYWIAKDYEFDESGDTYVQWHLETTQKEKLPQERLNNKWYFDDRGFSFVTAELVGNQFGIYRVAKKEIPKSYSVYLMNTGKHNGSWVWKTDFRPYFDFENLK